MTAGGGGAAPDGPPRPGPDEPPRRRRSLLSWLREAWRELAGALSDLGAVPLIAGLIGLTGYLLLCTPQGRDLALTLTENGISWSQTAALAATSLLLGAEAWFWCRQIIDASQHASRTPKPVTIAEIRRARQGWPARWVLEWFPRLLGGGPFAIAAAAIFLSRYQDLGDAATLGPVLAVEALIGLVFLALLWARLALLERMQAGGKAPLLDPQHLPKWARGFEIFSLGLAAAAMVWICVDPVWLPQQIGAIGVVYLGVALIIPAIAVAVRSTRRLKLPVAGGLVVLAMLWSALGVVTRDNHAVGRRAFDLRRPAAPVTKPLTFETAFDAWYAQAPASPLGGPKPMIVVAAEGGASRAGFWTAETLGRLQDDSKGAFARSLFAISSVSGGSVGAAAFVSQVREGGGGRGGYWASVRDASGGDYLSPVVAGLLFPDLLQRFLPTIPAGWLHGVLPDVGRAAVFALPDRAEALETAFERGWAGHCDRAEDICRPGDRDLWRRPFLNLWSASGPWTPLLVINGARQEDGRRVLTAPFPVEPRLFPDAADFHLANATDVAVSSAIHNGARFPLVSPGGTLIGPDGKPQGHIIDGGYFEGSGVTTAADIVRAAAAYGAATGRPVRPIVVELNNDSDSPAGSPVFARAGRAGRPVQAADLAPSRTSWFLADFLGPLQGVSQSRDGRATAAAIGFARAMQQPPLAGGSPAPLYAMLQLCNTAEDGRPTTPKAPMDWALSATAKEIMARADDPRRADACHNRAPMRAILDAIGHAPASYGS